MFERYKAYRAAERKLEAGIRELTETFDGQRAMLRGHKQDYDAGKTPAKAGGYCTLENLDFLEGLRLPILKGNVRPRKAGTYIALLGQLDRLYDDVREMGRQTQIQYLAEYGTRKQTE